jgi:hypothetical protein
MMLRSALHILKFALRAVATFIVAFTIAVMALAIIFFALSWLSVPILWILCAAADHGLAPYDPKICEQFR